MNELLHPLGYAMSEHSQRVPFAVRHSSTINLAVAVALILSAVLLAFVTREPAAYIPVLIYGLSTLRQAQGHEPITTELAGVLRAWVSRR